MALTAIHVPGLLTGPTRSALRRSVELHFESAPGGAGLALALLLLHGPYLVALFAGFTGASVAQNAIGSEAARGGLELLLSSTYRIREIFAALLLSSLALTLVAWAVLAVGTVGVAAGVLTVLDASFSLPRSYLVLGLLLPLPMAFWANLIALFAALRFPRLTQFATGTTNALQFVAVVPALVLFLLVNLRPDVDPVWFAGTAIVLALLGSVLGGLLLGRSFRPDLILET